MHVRFSLSLSCAERRTVEVQMLTSSSRFKGIPLVYVLYASSTPFQPALTSTTPFGEKGSGVSVLSCVLSQFPQPDSSAGSLRTTPPCLLAEEHSPCPLPPTLLLMTVVEMSRPDAQAAAKKMYDEKVRGGKYVGNDEIGHRSVDATPACLVTESDP